MNISLISKVPVTRGAGVFRSPVGLWLALALPLSGVACGSADEADEFRAAVPYHEDIAMVVPGSGSVQQSALTAGGVTQVRSALLGQQADAYGMTRDITVTINGATAAVLALVRTVTDYPASSVKANEAVWGPFTDALSTVTWRLTVNRVGTGMFHYVFDGKPRASDDSAYLTVLSGDHTVANPGVHRRANLPAYGSGGFVLDWDNARKLPKHDADDNVGKANFTYSRPSATADVIIDATFIQVLDKGTGMLVDAQYGYVATPEHGGRFQFTLTKDAVTTTSALETLSVRSRWRQDGAGRADIKVVGGDVGVTGATANECWGTGDLGFLSTYQTNSYGDAAKMWGAQSDCVFPAADYAMF